MKPYFLQNHRHPAACASALKDLALIEAFMRRMPDPTVQPHLNNRPGSGLAECPYGEPPTWTCHALTRAAQQVLPLELEWHVRDGNFGMVGHGHCWLEHQTEETQLPEKFRMEDGFILDAYPWAQAGGPMLLCANWRAPWQRLYQVKEGLHSADHLETYQAEAAIAIKAWNDRAR